MSDCSCGPDWLPEKWVHWYLKIPVGEKCFFHEACVLHDEDYYTGRVSRNKADQNFLVSMVTIAQEGGVSFEELAMAIKYYQFVRYGGWISYNIHRVKRFIKRIL